MFRIKLLVSTVLVFAGCSSYILVKPFIDVDETFLLSPKMSKNLVLQYLGTPAEVRAGILLTDSSFVEIWIYNVKEKLARIPKGNMNAKPPKKFKAENWDISQKYALFFFNDRLTKWGYLEDTWSQFEKSGDIIAPVQNPAANSSTGNNSKGLFGILKHNK